MAVEWREVAVEDVKAPSENALATGPFGSSIGSKFFRDSGVPVIRGSNLSEEVGTRLSDEGLVFLSLDKAREFARSTVRDGDLVFTCWGTINQVGLIDRRAAYREYVISNKQMKLTPDPAKADSLFLYYLFSSPGLQHQIMSRSIGTSVPGFNLGQLRSMRIRIPDVNEQRAMALILGTLDDKIELNRRMNETLDAAARAIFQSWFVDFDPVRAKAEGRDPGLPRPLADLFPDRFVGSELGEIPAGWKVGPILEIARLRSGGTPKTGRAEYWGGGVPWASAKDVSQAGEPFLVETERTITPQGLAESATQIVPAFCSVVVARGATTGRMVLLGHAMAMNQTCYALETKTDTPVALYCHLRQEIVDLVHAAHGSVFDTITTNTFATSKVILPPAPVLKRFEEAAGPLFHRILVGTRAARAVAALRDTLLPKLMSGEIRPQQADRLAEAHV